MTHYHKKEFDKFKSTYGFEEANMLIKWIYGSEDELVIRDKSFTSFIVKLDILKELKYKIQLFLENIDGEVTDIRISSTDVNLYLRFKVDGKSHQKRFKFNNIKQELLKND